MTSVDQADQASSIPTSAKSSAPSTAEMSYS